MVEITSEGQNKVKRIKTTEDNRTDLWDNIKCTNIQIIGVPEEEEKNKGYDKIFEEIIVENFPNMEKEIVNQVQEMQRVLYRINSRRTTLRHILIKLTKIKHKEKNTESSKGKILKAVREKQQVTYKGNSTQLTASFKRNSAGQRQWQDVFKVTKGKNLQPRLHYPATISFNIDREIKSFTDKS